MTATLALGLLLQLIAVLALRIRLGKTWLRRPAVILVLASCVYDGLSPLLLLAPSAAAQDIYRNGIAPQWNGDADLLLSAAMLALTLGYLLTRPERSQAQVPAAGRERAAGVLDWRILALAALPLAVLTYAGHGYNSGGPATGNGASTGASLASAFLVPLVILAALGFLLRHGTRWFLPVLAAQSLLLAAAGERTPVVIAAIALAVTLAVSGERVPRRQACAALAVTAVIVLALTGARAVQGRVYFHQETGLSGRASALASGIGAIGSGTGLASQAAMRLDGVSFTAAILQAHAMGQPSLPASGIPASLLIAVPSAAWDGKLSSGTLNPAQREIDDFGLRQVNFLPGLPGMYAGFASWPWLIFLLGLLGVVAGWGERWLLRSWSPARLVMLAGAVTAALRFEQGLPSMLVTLRTSAVIMVAVAGLAAVLGRRSPGRRAATGSS